MGQNRLDGWKAISNYFNRDRSTVMRWAQHRGLPVYRVPGGKQGSVFAYEHELAAWAAQGKDTDMPDEAAAAPAAPPVAPSAEPVSLAPAAASPLKSRWIMAAVAALALAGCAFLAQSLLDSGQRAVAELPSDKTAAANYLAARDLWATRKRENIARAIELYEDVIAREPGFAPAYAAISEAWLIIREYGDIGDQQAYNAAQTAALRALRLDPDLPAGHRAMGFIHYWRENDAPRAIAAFERALALNDQDSLTHFWYANVLSDLGRHDAARKAFDKARLLSPGSQVIEVEAACAEWQAGRDAIALARLDALARKHPDDATVHNCLAWLHIGRGDILRFAQAYTAFARSRGEPVLIRRADALAAAVSRDPRLAHRVVTADMRRELATGERRGRETPAFYASSMGDREELLEFMADARNAGEQWHSRTIITRIAARWKDDAEIQRMIALLGSPDPATSADTSD